MLASANEPPQLDLLNAVRREREASDVKEVVWGGSTEATTWSFTSIKIVSPTTSNVILLKKHEP